MWGGLFLSYGTFAAFVLRYLTGYQREPVSRRLFVVRTAYLPPGGKNFKTPDGESYLLTDLGEDAEGERYVAFSSTCPHLGCKVIWQNQKNQYYCPCHNGVFNPNGKSIDGPPAKEGKNLKKCKLEIKDGVIYALYEIV